MIALELTDPEATMLRELVEADLSDLRMEIAGTESAPFREELKQKEEFLNSVLRRLVGSPGPQ